MFAGRTAIVTGASSGLGAALALKFARAGARLALFGRREDQLEETARSCEATGAETLVVRGDVTRPGDCEALVARTVERHGNLDYLVANAGMSMWARFDEIRDPTLFRNLMEINYLGVVHCLLPALPHLKRSRGMLVAISSIQGEIGVPLHSGYVASKHALQGLVKTLRIELQGSGVDILTVLPHWIRGTGLRANAAGYDGRPLSWAAQRHSSESISLEACSEAVLRAVAQRRKELVIPRKLRFLPWLELIDPRLVAFFVGRAVREQRN
ncbi:MAG: SDR family oxidoreductase [Truepera sp.]|nr:SDR family oxidoreductase [Truepera sp.]